MLQSIVDQIVYRGFGLDPQAPFAGLLHFFIYDSLKIFSLLTLMIFIISVVRTYIPQDQFRVFLLRHHILGYCIAALLGAITPFCSCSSIPIFIGFVQGGIPIGMALTFLITSPIINEYLVVLMAASFGISITLIYILAGFTIGVFGGILLHHWGAQKQIDSEAPLHSISLPSNAYTTFLSRLQYGWTEVITILKHLWHWILLGIGIGAFIHNYVPQETLHNWVGTAKPFDVPIAVILGVPLYGNCAAIVPIATALFQKGIPLGTALSFMIAVTALSLPEAIMLRRVITLTLIAKFFFIVTTATILVGYGINFIARWL